MHIRNMTELVAEEADPWEFFYTSFFLDHTLPFVLVMTVIILTLIPCCLLRCHNKKRSRLSVIADSENTEELAGLRFEDLDGRRLTARETPVILTKRNLEVFNRAHQRFTRLESINEEDSKANSLKSISTFADLTETVEGLRNSLSEELGGRLNEKVGKQLKQLLDKIRSLKDRPQKDYEECDSGLALLTPESRGLSFQFSVDSRKSLEVDKILENIRVNTEDLKEKIEKKLQAQNIDDQVVTVVEKEVSQAVSEMLQSFPPTPTLKQRLPASPLTVEKPQPLPRRGHNLPEVHRSTNSLSEEKYTLNDEDASRCSESKQFGEPTAVEENEADFVADTLPSNWRPTPEKLKNKEIKEGLPAKLIMTSNFTGGADMSFMVWTPEPKETEMQFQVKDVAEISTSTNQGEAHPVENRKTDSLKDLKSEEHGLWELEMAMIGMREDIDRSIKIHSPRTKNKDYFASKPLKKAGPSHLLTKGNGDLLNTVDIDNLMAELCSGTYDQNQTQHEDFNTSLDSHCY